MTNLKLKNDILDIDNSKEPSIIWESQKIVIPFDEQNKRDHLIFSYIRELQRKLSSLEKDLKRRDLIDNSYIESDISDIEARQCIVNFLKENKKSGKNRISMIDITSKLHISGHQVERILESLVKEGVIGVD